MARILTVIGTRPEVIKMAPVIELLEQSSVFHSRVCLTGQHRQLLEQAIEFFKLDVHHNLEIMQHDQSLHEITSRVLNGMKTVLEKEEPDMILVHGDTTTSFAASLAAFYAGIPIGHVEAGLRTGNLKFPFPEEANRTLTASLANVHFAPTETSRANLLSEGIQPENIFVTGNTVIDALFKTRAWVRSMPVAEFDEQLGCAALPFRDAFYQRRILITGHRRENFGRGFENICKAMSDIAKRHPDWLLVYPVHLNPNVREPVMSTLSGFRNICLIEPVSYAPFVYLMDKCDLIITDSGGIQEEASSIGKSVLVMRDITERSEAIKVGHTVLVGTDRARIVKETERMLLNEDQGWSANKNCSVYGDGHAAERIVSILKSMMIKDQSCVERINDAEFIM